MGTLILLILSVLLQIVGLIVGALSLRLVKDYAPPYRPRTLKLWMTPGKARTFFEGNGCQRLRWGAG